MMRVALIAIKKEDKWLVMKRAPNDEIPDFWEFPGGAAEEGESEETAAKREMWEETLLDATSLRLLGETKVPSFKDPAIIHDLHHFHCAGFSGELKLSEEHCEYRWLTKEEILKLKLSPGTLNHLKLI